MTTLDPGQSSYYDRVQAAINRKRQPPTPTPEPTIETETFKSEPTESEHITYQIISGHYVATEFDNFARALQKMLHSPSGRPRDVNRYQDNDLPGFNADVPIEDRGMWTQGKHNPIMGEAGKPFYKEDQLGMLFFEGDLKPTEMEHLPYSAFLEQSLHCFPPVGRPQHKVNESWFDLPVNVKAMDCYLGSLWLYTKTQRSELHRILPFDVNTDGGPHSERLPIGEAFRPRALCIDYPGPSGPTRDYRIAYIIFKGDLIILGGEGFDKTTITDTMLANWHHWFIDISARNSKALFSVADEPEEVRRRKTTEALEADLCVFRPEGVPSAIQESIPVIDPILSRVRVILKTNTDDNSVLSAEDYRHVMSNVPIRGFPTNNPPWESLAAAHISSSIFYGAYISGLLALDSLANAVLTHIEDVDGLLDHLIKEKPPSYADILDNLLDMRNDLAAVVSEADCVHKEIKRATQGIPKAHEILASALPIQAIPPTVLDMSTGLYGVLTIIGQHVVGPSKICPKRGKKPINKSVNTPKLSYPAPYKNMGQGTAAILQSILAGRYQIHAQKRGLEDGVDDKPSKKFSRKHAPTPFDRESRTQLLKDSGLGMDMKPLGTDMKPLGMDMKPLGMDMKPLQSPTAYTSSPSFGSETTHGKTTPAKKTPTKAATHSHPRNQIWQFRFLDEMKHGRKAQERSRDACKAVHISKGTSIEASVRAVVEHVNKNLLGLSPDLRNFGRMVPAATPQPYSWKEQLSLDGENALTARCFCGC